MNQKNTEQRKEIEKIVKEVVEEITRGFDDFDIRNIPISILRSAYRDLRLTPTSVFYGDVFSDLLVKEAYGDIFEPDEAIKKILNRYALPIELARKKEHFHKIYIYIIIAKVGKNIELIEHDMLKLGYFLSHKEKPMEIQNMVFQKLQFEPMSQIQKDVTEEISENNDFLYHWTPSYNAAMIKEKGLIPSSKNYKFTYPPRTYLIVYDGNDSTLYGLGQNLCTFNENPNNNGLYSLLKVDLKKIGNDVRLYYDPNSIVGVYTEQRIPKDAIDFVTNFQFVKKLID